MKWNSSELYLLICVRRNEFVVNDWNKVVIQALTCFFLIIYYKAIFIWRFCLLMKGSEYAVDYSATPTHKVTTGQVCFCITMIEYCSGDCSTYCYSCFFFFIFLMVLLPGRETGCWEQGTDKLNCLLIALKLICLYCCQTWKSWWRQKAGESRLDTQSLCSLWLNNFPHTHTHIRKKRIQFPY